MPSPGDSLDRALAVGGAVQVTPQGEWLPLHPPLANSPPALLPGAFNPVHDGHWKLAEVAADLLGQPAALELSLANVDKADVAWPDAVRRVEQFASRTTVFITKAAKFVQKAELFPGTVFVIGADTAARIIEPRYYESGPGVANALAFLRGQGCRFLVGGRVDVRQRFVRLAELPIPQEFRDLFSEIPDDVFRVDLSSSNIRSRRL